MGKIKAIKDNIVSFGVKSRVLNGFGPSKAISEVTKSLPYLTLMLMFTVFHSI